MSTDLVPPHNLVNPTTGELIPLTAPTPDLGHLLADIRIAESALREQKNLICREINRRFDQTAQWTHHFEGGLKITGQSPKPAEEWNAAELREALLDLQERGLISIEAVDAAVETVVNYVVRKAGVNSLRKLGGEVADTVNRLCQTSEPERRVTVSRS